MDMKKMMMAMVVAAAAFGARAEELPTYSLGLPRPAAFRNSLEASSNEWLEVNAVFVATGGYECYTNGSESANEIVGATERYRLMSSEVGFSWERSKPEYYLADVITPPEDVDWKATADLYADMAAENPDSVAGFLLNPDPDNLCVYATDGGTHPFTWVLKDGTRLTLVYTIGSVCQGRPKRIYWTDAPYNAPYVSLAGKFVKFFGNDAVLDLQLGTVTNVVGGQQVEEHDKVVSGLYLDQQANILYAKGRITGQVIMVYYDSGNFDKILDVQVLEVCQPQVIVNKGVIGQPLKPNGRGYNIDGLTARVSAGIGDSVDNRGDYLYQHAGQYSYSPKNGYVYPLRPSVGERWKAEVYWMETDAMKVQWPFEVDQYENDWPEDIQRYVRGDIGSDSGSVIEIPTDYIATLGKFQEPEGHAVAPDENNRFYTLGAGYSLLKLTGSDNVWFLPIQSVLRSDKTLYTLKPERINVGDEITVRGGSYSGLAEGARAFHATMDTPGYIYEAATPAGNYDANIYAETNTASSIYAVNTNGDIEVWWKESFQNGDMPVAITVPTLPQVYRPIWPEPDEAPQIVIASQQGSANEVVACRNGAASMDSETASMQLSDAAYFPGGTGTLMFWLRRGHYNDPPTALPDFTGHVLTLGRDAGGAGTNVLDIAVKVAGGQAKILVETFGAVAQFPATVITGRQNQWRHFAAVFSGGTCTLVVDGAEIGSVPFATSFAWASVRDNFIGVAREGQTAFKGTEIAEVTMFRDALSVEEIKAEAYRIRTGAEAAVTGYYSFRQGEDLVAATQQSGVFDRTFLDRVTGRTCPAKSVLYMRPGAPAKSGTVISADETPTLYCQNDPTLPGYNPNEEHGFVTSGAGGYVAWALRSDLGTDETPPLGVFAEYVRGEKNRLQFFHVVLTNDEWSTLSAPAVAGKALPGPVPLTRMMNPWLPQDYWEQTADGRIGPAYRDRKGQIWARAAGDLRIHMYYEMQDGFYFPQLADYNQPAVGTAIPWLSLLDERVKPDQVLTAFPAAWTWNIAWPENLNTMKIGQTLTTAEYNLPEVWNMKSASVVYPVEGVGGDVDRNQCPVMLSDPTVMQSVPCELGDRKGYDLLLDFGFSTDPNGGLVQRKGNYYFTELPPSVSSRVYLDSSNNRLCCFGERVEKNAGATVLYPNVLSASERRALVNVMRLDESAKRVAWEQLVADLAQAPVLPNTMATVGSGAEVVTTYNPVDHYALTALGPTNYVVIIENDASRSNMVAGVNCPVNEGDPIEMHVFRVVPEYYKGRIVTREDENNLLSQQLSVLYTDPIGGKADDFVFEWKHAEPNADGTIPENYESGYLTRAPSTACGEPEDGAGLTRFVVGQQGDTLANMVNTYWICRYRAKEGTPAYATMGEKWSEWCAPPALAEGWVQRVLNNVTPFNQRMTDLYANKAETAVSMIQQAGGPYTGDVALNNDNLTSVGLIQLYETILNKAESMSIGLPNGQTTAAVTKQLQLAVERLGDLYKVLGDEAYSDAKNPTVALGEMQEMLEEVEFTSEATSLFCFDNQVSSLLDEELCLLRGRTGVSAPTVRMGPYYNRLLWNFTKGITAGEVAYAVNYAVGGTETVALSEEQAARTYPQGHGDAYGHYLSALKGWYRLLRNPNFSWFMPAQGEMSLADSSVNVDYYEEAKFAAAAADLAKTAADVVDLTARKAWRDQGAVGSGYLDAKEETAFGYGEWASRGAYGALVNWVTANSILPEDCTLKSSGFNDELGDKGLTRIDRGTVDELKDICQSAAAIMRVQDRLDAGLNPIGLSERAIPFDIAPDGVEDGSNTHFEQVRDRAKTALANARAVLTRAQQQANRIRLVQDVSENYANSIASQEEDWNNELVNIYGRPYSDDVGPSGSYPQGYDGPDLIHYMWMDLGQYGLTEVEDTCATNVIYYTDLGNFQSHWWYMITAIFGGIQHDLKAMEAVQKLQWDVSASGLVVKPERISGRRPMQGSLQEKYGAFLTQYAAVKQALRHYSEAEGNLQVDIGFASMMGGVNFTLWGIDTAKATIAFLSALTTRYATLGINMIENAEKIMERTGKSVVDSMPATIGAGLTVVTSPKSFAQAVESLQNLSTFSALENAKLGLQNSQVRTVAGISLEAVGAEAEASVKWYSSTKEIVASMREKAYALNAAYDELQKAVTDLNVCIEDYRSELAKGEQILEKREAERKRQVSKLSQYRYNEMLFRKIRDKALTRYSAAFDLAQKYVYMAAQVYDYETGLKREEEGSADGFKAKIVATRQLGAFDEDGEPVVADDGDLGLSGYLAQMDANWQVLKPRLGINNPQPYATWFSLRRELCRILPGEAGDAAWGKELVKHWTDDILSNAEFKRYCQPFQSQFGLREKEPGLVIPFETTIDFAKNLFGNELAGGDHAYDSSWYSTRIAAAGVWFENYNQLAPGAAKGAATELADTPVAYLVPVGFDCLRAPGLGDGSYWRFSVVDQVIPAPYSIGSYELDDDTWMPSITQADWQGIDATVKIRKHPSFRAYFGAAGELPDDSCLDATRLIGRSVWNTRWLLVIPAGAMNADRDHALSVFINGLDVNRDGKNDILPVSDIKIGFRTYSQSGN